MSDDAFGKLCALLAAVAWAVGVPLLRSGGTLLHPVSSCLIRNIIGALLFVVLLIFLQEPIAVPFSTLSWERHLIFILSGVVGISFADTAFFLGARHLQIGVIGLTQTVYSPLVVLFSAICLGERLSGIQLAGGCLVIASTILVNSSLLTDRESTKNESKGLLWLILCVISNVVAVLFVKVAIQDFPVLLLMPYRIGFGILPLVVWTVLQPKDSRVRDEIALRKSWVDLLPGAFFGTVLSSSLWVLGFAYTKAALAALINESSALFLLLIGWLVYRERLDTPKLLAAGLASLGLCLLWL